MIPAREDLDHPGMFTNHSHPQRRAIEECPAGAVLAIDCRKDVRGGCLGDILIARLMERGVAGVVTDGAMRDIPQIEPLAFPVYAGGAAAPASFGIHHAVDLEVPIACGDVAVFPGDVLVGDAEGVVVIPRHLADEVARDAAEQEQLESWILKEVKAGKGIFGLYPPDDDTRARYQAWREACTSGEQAAGVADGGAASRGEGGREIPAEFGNGSRPLINYRETGLSDGRHESWSARLSSGTPARSVMP